jgi:hypothetical protein
MAGRPTRVDAEDRVHAIAMGTRKRRAAMVTAAHGHGRGRALAAVAVIAAAAALAWVSWRPAVPGAKPAGSDAAVGSLPAAPPAASAPDRAPEFAALVGNWVRPDGGYELSVSRVGADGTATVSYFNPRPIRVAQAEARREGGRLTLFVRFDDVNYPGSTYSLAYHPADDSLRGDYFQAVQSAHYDVVFVRRR